MSIHTFTRNSAPASSFPSTAPVIVLGHGGGSTYWTASHPLTRWTLTRAPIVHSLQLPLHGSDAQREMGMPFSNDEEKRAAIKTLLADKITEVLLPVIAGRYAIFVGYSTSAICFLKLFRSLRTRAHLHPRSMLLCIGSALCLGDTDVFIQQFWREETFQSNAAKYAAMKKMHTKSKTTEDDDESWRNCTRMIEAATAHRDSGLFTTKEERLDMFREPALTAQQRQKSPSSDAANYIFFIQAEGEQPFPADQCIAPALLEVQQSSSASSSSAPSRAIVQERLRVLDGGDHFSYFLPLKAGGQLENVLRNVEELVQAYGETEQLKEWKQTAPPQQSKPKGTKQAVTAAAASANSFASSSHGQSALQAKL